jgi:hypothetical protein
MASLNESIQIGHVTDAAVAVAAAALREQDRASAIAPPPPCGCLHTSSSFQR